MCSTQASSASKTVYDKRDEKDYQVRYINGNCWMVQNLRLAGNATIYKTNSNISNNSYTLPSDSVWGFNDYTVASMHCSDDVSFGCYYNYAAATAGTITGSSNSDIAEYSICPSGWRIPSRSEYLGISTYVNEFQPVVAGDYANNDGTLHNTTTGYLWTATPGGATNRYYMWWQNGKTSLGESAYDVRKFGRSLRCIRAS